MQTPYSPMAFLEALEKERRAAARTRAVQDDITRPSARHWLGQAIVRLGRRVRGARTEPVPTFT